MTKSAPREPTASESEAMEHVKGCQFPWQKPFRAILIQETIWCQNGPKSALAPNGRLNDFSG